MSHIQRDAYEPTRKMGCGKPSFYFWLILEISRISVCFFEAVLIVLPFESPCSAGKCPTDSLDIVQSNLQGIRRDRYLSLGCQGRDRYLF